MLCRIREESGSAVAFGRGTGTGVVIRPCAAFPAVTRPGLRTGLGATSCPELVAPPNQTLRSDFIASLKGLSRGRLHHVSLTQSISWADARLKAVWRSRGLATATPHD